MQRLEDYRLRGGISRPVVAPSGPSTSDAVRLLELCRAERVGWVELRLAAGRADQSDLNELTYVARQLVARNQAGGLSKLDRLTAARADLALAALGRLDARTRSASKRRGRHGQSASAPLEYR